MRLRTSAAAILLAAATLATPTAMATPAPSAAVVAPAGPTNPSPVQTATLTGYFTPRPDGTVTVVLTTDSPKIHLTYRTPAGNAASQMLVPVDGTATVSLPGGSNGFEARAVASQRLRASDRLVLPERDTTPPGPVTGLEAEPGMTSVTATWTNPTDADFATVIVRRTTGTTPAATPTDGAPVTLDAATATALSDTGLTPDAWYSYALFTRDATGNTSAATTIRVRTQPLPSYHRVGANYAHSCALVDSGRVQCWGDNGWGNLGDGTRTARTTPVTVVGLTDAVSITVGRRHTCALRAGGSVACWGSNYDGQLGDGTVTDRSVPVQVSGLLDAVSVTAGQFHTCALRRTGAVVCWGHNWHGQLGNGDQTARSVPGPVTGVTNAVAVTAGGLHSCAILADRTVTCWGSNVLGQLGDGTIAERSTVPVATLGIGSATAVSAGLDSTCATLADGSVRCWGGNGWGQLGDGTTTTRVTPTDVVGLRDAVDVTAGGRHTCARRGDGSLACWGSNWDGQLGDGTSGSQATTPVAVSGPDDATDVSAGRYHTCAAAPAGIVRCWGYNGWGQIGDGTRTNRSTPVTVVSNP